MTKQERILNGSFKASQRKSRIETLGGFGAKLTKSVESPKVYNRKKSDWRKAWED